MSVPVRPWIPLALLALPLVSSCGVFVLDTDSGDGDDTAVSGTGGGPGSTSIGAAGSGGSLTGGDPSTAGSAGEPGTTSTSTDTGTDTDTGTNTGTDTTSTIGDECVADSDCPDPEPDLICIGPRCQDGFCTSQPTAELLPCGIPDNVCFGTPICHEGACIPTVLEYGLDVPGAEGGTCQKLICDGQGNIISVADDTNTYAEMCFEHQCQDGVVTVVPINDGKWCGGDFFPLTCQKGVCTLGG
ncbi:MAG: hypothetical protein R3B70_44680 [Polyangiaceae bacterium]